MLIIAVICMMDDMPLYLLIIIVDVLCTVLFVYAVRNFIRRRKMDTRKEENDIFKIDERDAGRSYFMGGIYGIATFYPILLVLSIYWLVKFY